jgi:flavin-dependent dehydrogenase
MKLPASCDVAIIGGGPAGSLAATYLARAGYEVALLERDRHPRFNVGESLIPDFWRYCDEAGVSAKLEAEGFVRKAGGTVDWHGHTRRLAFKDFGYTRPALHVERDRFDWILLEHARASGAAVFEQVTAQETALGADGCRVECLRAGESRAQPLACRFVVDASGQNAVLGRRLGLRRIDDAFRFMSVWGYFRDSRYFGADGEMHPASKVREVPPTTYVTSLAETGRWGWSWHITMRASTSVGLVVPIAAAKAAKGERSWESYFLQVCRAQPRLAALLEGAELVDDKVHVIRDYSYRSTEVAGPGFFLTGDAAGFVDPIFSVGVVLSMYSARAAAWAIERSLRQPARTAEHQAIFSAQLQDRMELARTLALPQYELDGPASRQAKNVVQFSNRQARALLLAASGLTARSRHVQALLDEAG